MAENFQAEYAFICAGEIERCVYEQKTKKGRLILKVALLHLWRGGVKTTSRIN